MTFDRSTPWFEENTCSAKAENPRSPFFRAYRCSRRRWSKDLPVWSMYVGAGAFSMRDAVHHSFPVVCWYWVLGVHKLLPRGPEGMEGNLDG